MSIKTIPAALLSLSSRFQWPFCLPVCGDVFGGQLSVVSPVFCMQAFIDESTLSHIEKSDIDRGGGFQKKVIICRVLL